MTPEKPKRSWRGALLRIGGSAGVLGALFWLLPVGKVWAAMRGVSPRAWLLVLTGYMLVHLMAVVKWRILINVAGAELTIGQAARCYFAGLFGNVFLPSIVGGDVVRAGLGLRLGKNKAGLLLGSLIDRVLDVVALGVLAGGGALLVPGALEERSRKVFIGVAGALAAAGLLAIAGGALVFRKGFSYRMRKRLVKVRQAIRSVARQPQYMLLSLTLGITVQTGFALLTASLAEECGVHLSPVVWLFAFPISKLWAFLPVTQGGIGVREAALIVLLRPFGVPGALTMASGLVWEAVVLAGGLLGGLISLLVGKAPADRAAQNGAKTVAIP